MLLFGLGIGIMGMVASGIFKSILVAIILLSLSTLMFVWTFSSQKEEINTLVGDFDFRRSIRYMCSLEFLIWLCSAALHFLRGFVG